MSEISGVLGIYVETLTPKIKSLVYKYLLFVKNRADTANQPLSVVTNDPIVSSMCERVQIDLDLVWRTCDQLYVFAVSEDVTEGEYLQQVLDAIECPYEVVNSIKDEDLTEGKTDLLGLKFDQDDAPKMGHSYEIKNLVRENPDPYPMVIPQSTPMFQQFPTMSSVQNLRTDSWYDRQIKLWASVFVNEKNEQVGAAGYGRTKASAEADRNVLNQK